MISKLLSIAIFVLLASSAHAKTTADEVYQKELDKLDPVRSMNAEASNPSGKDSENTEAVQNLPFASSSDNGEKPEYTMDSPDVDLVLKEDFFFINSQDTMEKPQKLSIDAAITSDSEKITIGETQSDQPDTSQGIWETFANFCKNFFGFNNKSERS